MLTKNSIRAEAGDGSFTIGAEYTNKSFIHVRWGWLSILGALELAIFILLFGTMILEYRTKTAS
jgi:hypothetical protein